MHHVAFAIICLLWGSNFILMKKATVSFGPISVAAWRVALGAIVVAIIMAIQREPWPVRRRHLPHLCLVAVCSYIFPFTAQPYVIAASGSSAFVGMMVSLVPLSTILVSIPMLRIHPSPRQIVGVIGGLLCFVIVFREGATVQGLTWVHLLLSAGVPVGYAIVNTYIKKYLHDLPAVPLTFMSLLLASIGLVPLSLLTETVQVNDGLTIAILALLQVGIIGTGIATILFYKLIHDHGPLFAGMVTYIIPIVAMLFGMADREAMSWLQVAALCGIFLMVALVQKSSPRPVITHAGVNDGA